MMDEELAGWWEEADLIQEAVYSGHVKAHSIKVLTVLFSNGITGYLYGSISGRKNDIAILNVSWLIHQLLLLQEDVTAAFAHGKARKSIEWMYGDNIVLFHVMHETYSKNYFLPDCTINKVLHQQLRVLIFIYNCYVCFNNPNPYRRG